MRRAILAALVLIGPWSAPAARRSPRSHRPTRSTWTGWESRSSRGLRRIQHRRCWTSIAPARSAARTTGTGSAIEPAACLVTIGSRSPAALDRVVTSSGAGSKRFGPAGRRGSGAGPMARCSASWADGVVLVWVIEDPYGPNNCGRCAPPACGNARCASLHTSATAGFGSRIARRCGPDRGWVSLDEQENDHRPRSGRGAGPGGKCHDRRHPDRVLGRPEGQP